MRRIFLLSHPIHSASAGILFGLALLIGACSARRDEGNAPEPVVPALDTLFVIGADDGPEDEIIDAVAFRGRPILDQGPDGLIWVVNPAGSNLLVFDAEGEKTAVYGRMGSGPGEFFDVAALSAIQDGAWTWDWRNQQLCRWSARNGLVRTWRTELGQPNSNKAVLEADGTIWFFDQDFAGISDHSVTHNLLRVPAGSDPDTLWQCEIPAAVTPAHMGIAPSYSPHFIHAPGEGVIVCGTYEYVLHHITEAEFTTWSLPTTNTPYSARALRPGGRGGVSESGSNKIYEPPLMPHKPDVEELYRANSQEFWVRTPVRDTKERYRYDVLDVRGRITGSYWMSGRLEAITRHGDLLVVMSTSPDIGCRIIGLRFNH